MAKTNSQLNNIDIQKVLNNLSLIFIQPLVELYEGISRRCLPLTICLVSSSILHVLLLCKIDVFFFKKMGLILLYPDSYYFAYKIIVTLFPFWGWGLFQVFLRIKLTKQLTKVFLDSGLKSATGRLPNFIFDKPLDEFTRKMRLSRNGLSESDFQGSKDKLESSLQVYIDEIKEHREKGSIDIIYSQKQLETHFDIKHFKDIKANSFLIGKGRSKNIYGNLINTPHLLVAGQTGMGKSTFLRQFIASLYVRNKNYSFDLIDLKEGLEFQIFENLPRVKVQSEVPSSIALLKKLATHTIKERSELFKANGCKDIAAFLSIAKDERKYPKGFSKNINLDRHIVVIDEAFDLFMVGPYADAKTVQSSRRFASKVAAQGRAVGIHLVIATQRPDRFAVDPQTKTHLVGKVCFRVGDIASSTTILDSKRGFELPNIKGRAIWKSTSDIAEIQTPFFSEDQASKMLEKYRKKKTQVEEKSSQANEPVVNDDDYLL